MTRRGQSLGKSWERTLDYWHGLYRAKGEAFIVHTHPGTKRVKGKLIYESKAPPDYIGTIPNRYENHDTDAVCFDAKATAAKRWAFSTIAKHQAQDLEDFQAMGGTSFIALNIQNNHFVVGWKWLGPRYFSTERPRSVTVEDLEAVTDVYYVGEPNPHVYRMGPRGWLGSEPTGG